MFAPTRCQPAAVCPAEPPAYYPAMDRRHFLGSTLAGSLALPSLARRLAPARPKLGCASITWDGNDPQAIDDIAAAGYRGIQLRTAAFDRWQARPAELKALLAERGLTFVALSSGVVSIDPARRAETIDEHLRHARFLREAGGLHLQVLDERPRGRDIARGDIPYMGRLLSEIGKRTSDLGITLALHNHMGNLSQSPAEVVRMLDVADERFVTLELDIAHWQAAGGDPVDAVRRYWRRISFLHLKDLQRPAPGGDASSYRFVELGQGDVNVLGVLRMLERAKFDGWAIVELDAVPAGTGRTPAECATLSKRYLERNGYAS